MNKKKIVLGILFTDFVFRISNTQIDIFRSFLNTKQTVCVYYCLKRYEIETNKKKRRIKAYFSD